MSETTYAGREEFSGDDESRGVGTEVEEHLKTRNQHLTSTTLEKNGWVTWAIVKQKNFGPVLK